ncbi:MAG: hypothetical protein IKR25_04545 [Muribaculaceae bacterium]|nr:hypothetical protein [Muribaculaceae bacterium]
MNEKLFQFYLHGHPKGFDYVGDVKEKDFFLNTFFQRIFTNEHNDGSQGFNELRVQALNVGGKTMFYYTYFIGKDIRGTDKRPGYLAITVRMSRYYKRVRNLMFLLDSFIHSYLEGKLLNRSGNQLEFKSDTFQNAEKTILSDFTHLETLLGMTFDQSDLVNLQVGNQRKRSVLNIEDASDENVEKLMRRDGEVSISINWPSTRVQQATAKKDQEIQTLKQTHAQELQTLKQAHTQELSKQQTDWQARLNKKEQELAQVVAQSSNDGKRTRELEQKLTEAEKQRSALQSKIDRVREIIGNPTQNNIQSSSKPGNTTKSGGGTNSNKGNNSILSHGGSISRKPHSWDEEEKPERGFPTKPIYLVVLIAIIAGICFFVFKSCFSNKTTENEANNTELAQTIQDANQYTDAQSLSFINLNADESIKANDTIEISTEQQLTNGQFVSSDTTVLRILESKKNDAKVQALKSGKAELMFIRNDTCFARKKITVE